MLPEFQRIRNDLEAAHRDYAARLLAHRQLVLSRCDELRRVAGLHASPADRQSPLTRLPANSSDGGVSLIPVGPSDLHASCGSRPSLFSLCGPR